MADIERIAHTIIQNSGVTSSDPYWSTSAELVLMFFMEYVYRFEPRHRLTLENVALTLDSFAAEPTKIDVLIAQTDELFIKRYKSLCATPEKTRDTILSVCNAALRIFKSPDIARCTATNNFSFLDFRTQNTILFLAIPLHRLDTVGVLLALFFETLAAQGMQKFPSPSDNVLYVLIDEVAVFRFSLGTLLSQGRKWKIAVLFLSQSRSTLLLKYSPQEAQAILSNVYTIVQMPGADLAECELLKRIIGHKNTEKDGVVVSHGQYIMEESQIRTLDKIIAVQAGKKPLLLPVIPYFEHPVFSSRAQIEPQHDNPILEPHTPWIL